MNKTKPNTICAIDASTNTIALAIFSDNKLINTGKIKFFGHNIYEKIIDATAKTRAFFKLYDIDAVVIEHTVFMNSPKTAADLAMVQGAIVGGIGLTGIKQIGRVSPITWQNYLGNKRLTKEEQLEIRSANPGKSDSWYRAYERSFRKERTSRLIDIIYDKKIDDDDVADACGIGHWAINNWEKAVNYA
jgi:Holliday junction resolvasome RuvABC endonuclease subunit